MTHRGPFQPLLFCDSVLGPGDLAAGTEHISSACCVTSPPTQAEGIRGRASANLSDPGSVS